MLKTLLIDFSETCNKIIGVIEEYRYYSAGVGDLRPLALSVIGVRLKGFGKAHKQEMKNRVALAGGKP